MTVLPMQPAYHHLALGKPASTARALLLYALLPKYVVSCSNGDLPSNFDMQPTVVAIVGPQEPPWLPHKSGNLSLAPGLSSNIMAPVSAFFYPCMVSLFKH